MDAPQITISAILIATMALFLWGRFRHDAVALASLMACVVAGLVPAADAFAGFGHPAVITVACVLVLSRGLQTTGAVDWLARAVLPREAGLLTGMAALMGLGAVLSGFMNNVGAMALLMPVAVQVAGRHGMPAGRLLMPLSFGTILGGMTTLVGTPPNLIVSGFRADAGGGHFALFDFSPVGASVALTGVLFVSLVGWRLVPARKSAAGQTFDTGAYLTEVRVPQKSRAVGLTLRAFEAAMEGGDAQVVALVRNEVRMNAPHGGRTLRAGDVVVLEAEVGGLAEALAVFDIKLEADKAKGGPAGGGPRTEPATESAAGSDRNAADGDDGGADARPRDEELVLRELAVLPGSTIVGRSASDLHLRTRYGLNLLAVSRAGRPPRARLRSLRINSGDLLLMQGPEEVLADFISETGCVPLGERDLRIPDRRKAMLAGAIMVGAVGVVALGLLPAAPAFALGVLAAVLLRTVPPRQVYDAIDWPVVVLLAALLPVAGAMQSTGAADLLAGGLVATLAQGDAVTALAVVLVVTMFLSDVMNNAATAAVMCPIAIGVANSVGANMDAFLMAVAVGASCAFLTPIGHQNNTLILGPGGFRFGDYWRLGLPLEALVVAVSLPLLLVFWPL